MTTIWIQNSDFPSCATAIKALFEAKEYAEAYQIGFDLWEGSTQDFLESVRLRLDELGVLPKPEQASQSHLLPILLADQY